MNINKQLTKYYTINYPFWRMNYWYKLMLSYCMNFIQEYHKITKQKALEVFSKNAIGDEQNEYEKYLKKKIELQY